MLPSGILQNEWSARNEMRSARLTDLYEDKFGRELDKLHQRVCRDAACLISTCTWHVPMSIGCLDMLFPTFSFTTMKENHHGKVSFGRGGSWSVYAGEASN
jgi:hypothetical protein